MSLISSRAKSSVTSSVFRLTVVLCKEISLLSKKFTSCLTAAGVGVTWGGPGTLEPSLMTPKCHWNTFNAHTQFNFCCEDWDLFFFTDKRKGRRPQPADNRSVFRGLCFSFKAAITDKFNQQPFFLSLEFYWIIEDVCCDYASFIQAVRFV